MVGLLESASGGSAGGSGRFWLVTLLHLFDLGHDRRCRQAERCGTRRQQTIAGTSRWLTKNARSGIGALWQRQPAPGILGGQMKWPPPPAVSAAVDRVI